ncbi:MAG: lipopolysaccharide heptosyltransferase II [Planctomycetota bacterium]|nr:lipopolysaccharide heptosyltransferase II [Planctomycetota bacterium]
MSKRVARRTKHLQLPDVPDGQKRILVRLPNWLGDVVMAAPSVAAIHAVRPQAEIVAQVVAPFLPLAGMLPGVARAIPANRDRSSSERKASAETLRALEADCAVIFPRSYRASIAPKRAGIPVRVGYGGPGRKRAYTHPVKGWKPYRREHRSRWFGLLARAFGTQPAAPATIDVPPQLRASADGLLRGLGREPSRPLVVFEPGASYGPAKCWAPERFGALAKRLLALGVDVATVGTDATKPVERIVAREAGPGLLRTAGATPDLGVLMGLLADANLVVSNDTGPMHLAAIVGTPVLALFGATDPVVSSPIGQGVRELIYDPEPCSPCFLRECAVPGHPCLGKVGVGRVFRQARGLLGS